MDNQNWLEGMVTQALLTQVLETNRQAEMYGLVLNKENAKRLLARRKEALREQGRVEAGQYLLPKLIEAFCDSGYVCQDNYVETLIRLQDIFYLYKNEMQDEISDDELLNFMREQFDAVCCGDLAYLEGTCLQVFAQAVRAGYRGFQLSEGRHEYGQFDEVPRWDKALYLLVLRELCWR